MPEYMHVVTPGSGFSPRAFGPPRSRLLPAGESGFEQFMGPSPDDKTYPDPNAHCDLCRWRQPCDARRRADDHLCLVAGITKVQISELRRHEIPTTTALAECPLPLTWKPDRGAVAFLRTHPRAGADPGGRRQAAGQALYELLPVQPELGLARLPEPSAGDVFLDLEGDPFVEEGGLEYLFGYVYAEEDGTRDVLWRVGSHRADERASLRAVRRLRDGALGRAFPDLHIYHYAPYEPAALKRLMGRYATREDEIDRMLRALLFVDLYQVVRHAIRASVESYSIKELEPLYRFMRGTPLQEANRALATVQARSNSGTRTRSD